jgi:hypothetical protein
MSPPSRDEPDDVHFVSEPIEPEAGSFAAEMMTQALAGLPGAFTWRGRRYEIVECLRHVKRSAPEGHTATGQRYLRRQQFLVRLDTGQVASIYVERQARRGAGPRSAKQRWFLYTISPGGTAGGGE